MTVAEQSALLTALLKMIRALQQQGQIPVSRMCATCVHFRPHVREGATPHHCAFVDAPMAACDLRLECADHDPAPESQARVVWAKFANTA